MRALVGGQTDFFVVDVALCNSRSHPHEKAASNAEENCRRYLEYLQKDFLVNEDDYLAANPDVAHAITRGRIPNAQYHYWNFGRREGAAFDARKIAASCSACFNSPSLTLARL